MTAHQPDTQIRVMVVEDDSRMLSIITRHLVRMGYDVHGAGGGAGALEAMETAHPRVVVSDIRMPGMDGRTLLQVLKERYPRVKVILMTAFGNVEDAVEAMKGGAYSYLCKPFKMEEMAAVLRNVCHEISLEGQVDSLRRAVAGRHTADRLIGQSAAMREVRQLIREATAARSPVLITGRSGTGKEMAARTIHFDGPRADGDFVPVNCAAVPEPLFESEMFGYCRGAFTGANRDRKGLMERSSGGTLFLDEVGEIPLPQQAKLLRALEQQEVLPLGGAGPVQLDLRVICATNRSLEAMVGRGEFREDLFYRINVLQLHMPELARRREDIPALAEHLMVDLSQEQGVPCRGFTPEALDALTRFAWPGNVRELRNVVERALFSARGRLIDLEDLPRGRRGPGEEPASEPVAEVEPQGQTLADVERAHIERILAQCQWNRSAAARILGIDRRTLFSKIKRYGLVGPLRGGKSRSDRK